MGRAAGATRVKARQGGAGDGMLKDHIRRVVEGESLSEHGYYFCHKDIVYEDNVRVPLGNLIGEEGRGFRYILDGMNAERILIASEAIGDGRWFVERAAKYASERKSCPVSWRLNRSPSTGQKCAGKE